MSTNKCEYLTGCPNKATRIALKAGGTTKVCDECWHQNFRS